MKSKIAFISFIIIRILLNHLWGEFSIYYLYLFEVVFVLIVAFCFRKKDKIKLIPKVKNQFFFKFLPWLPFGYIIYKAASYSNVLVPFEFKSIEMILTLLIVAPLLEELIFRFALWELFEDFVKNKELQVWVSALLFSLAHFIVILSVPLEFRPFVLYQSVYVIILGVGSSKMRQESNTVLGSILVHFLFNLGFLVGSF